MNDTHILVVDDDQRLRELLKRYLVQEGFMVTTASDTKTVDSICKNLVFDAIVLDVMMPGESGLDFLKRTGHGDTPVLLLSALGETEDRIKGLDYGADDYLPKPFEPRELVARLNSLLRRHKPRVIERYQFGPFTLDIRQQVLYKNGEILSFTPAEILTLQTLAENMGHPVLRENLAKDGQTPRAVDVHINRIRKKMGEDATPQYLQTVRGKGYVLKGK